MLLYDGATPDSRFKCLLTYKIHHQAKYQRLNANTLYVAAIFFSRSTLHREALPCLPNKKQFIIIYLKSAMGVWKTAQNDSNKYDVEVRQLGQSEFIQV